MKLKSLFLLFVLSVFGGASSWACTTAIISGKYSPTGRPIIWKLRDTGTLENKMQYFNDGKYAYIGLINSIDANQVWGGSNAAGFAIMNSASFNVNLNDTTSFKDQEGYFMKEALQKCANLSDFEKLLKKRKKPMGLAAHFGVLDAEGNVAFYEVNNYTFTKFDANDPTQAPNGYIIRTNFSFTGKKDIGYGFIRFQEAQDLFYEADAYNKLTAQTIVQEFSRCLEHPVLNRNYRKEFAKIPYAKNFINSGDMITRHESASMVMIEGVKANENPELSTIWSMVGYPNTCMAVPVWIKGGAELPSVLVANGNENSPLNCAALELKKKCYPIKRSAGYKYLMISELINAEKTGIIQRLETAEEMLFEKTNANIEKWHTNDVTKQEIQNYYQWLDQYVREFYNL